MNRFFCAALAATLSVTTAMADSKPVVQTGAFIDGFYAFDFNQPPDHERLFTTNPTRHNEFNINLAFVEAKASADRFHGRLALQAGTSVFTNYSTERRNATKPGGSQLADMLMYLQEAYAGYRFSDNAWVDAGIFFSHVGNETFISKDNWTYTRSLIADFSPYYQTGVRLTWEPTPQWSLQFHVLNGWQNILENNENKAVGLQVVHKFSEQGSITYNNFIGDESNGFRHFHDLFAKYQLTPFWESALSVDVGHQDRKAPALSGWWEGTSFVNRFRTSDDTHLAVRVEYFQDKNDIVVSTGTPEKFQVWGASTNLDVQLLPQLLWRNELRYLKSKDSIFPAAKGAKDSSVFFVSSVALTL